MDDTWIRIFALANVVDLGRELLYATVGAGAEITKVVGDRLAVDGGYTIRRKDYHNSDRSPFADERTGFEQIGRAHVELQSLMRNSYAVFCLNKNTSHIQ